MKLFLHGGGCGDACCLRVQNLSVKIGENRILQDVNMHVHCGEMVALIGPNGAGKSTLLKAILGQQEYEGVISFSSPGERNRKMRIGYVPQSEIVMNPFIISLILLLVLSGLLDRLRLSY